MTTENFVTRGLTSLGFTVTAIDVGAGKTPDLLVSDETDSYLVEVKDKFPDPDVEERRLNALNQSGTWDEDEPLGFRNTISSVVADGCEQLAAFDGGHRSFRLLWLHARSRHPDAQLEQFVATLYGAVDLIDTGEIQGSVPARPCYYFDFAGFFRHRDVLDGAFVSTDERGLLCLNPLSLRCESFRASRLFKSFPATCDPVEEETSGQAYIADCDISRREVASVLVFVRQKYGRAGLVDFKPVRYSAEAVVNREGSGKTV